VAENRDIVLASQTDFATTLFEPSGAAGVVNTGISQG
jgi:hypothetical protein